MALAKRLIQQPLYAWLLILICGIGGSIAYFVLGRLEDPAFTIKTAIVVTQYPGASASQVEHEVTEKMESAIQKMEQIDFLSSRSLAGYSEIKVHILDHYNSDALPQIWDELRHKVAAASNMLPPGAGPAQVNDDFGDVYGIYYAVTGDQYTPAQLYDYLHDLRRDILAVDGVADVAIKGQLREEIVVSIDQAKLVVNNLALADIQQALAVQNAVQPSGNMQSGALQIRVTPNDTFQSAAAVAAVPIGKTPSPLTVGDIAEVYRSYAVHPTELIRYNGAPALTFGVSGLSSVNIVDVGHRVEQRLKALRADRPLGISLHPLYQQHRVVDDAVNGFLINVASSVAIVLAVLYLSLGWRSGLVLALVLTLTVTGTLLLMYALGITLQRVSLGALIIVMGMLADNAIVICEGMLVRVEQGKRHLEAADAVLTQTKWPLFGATVVGILAFSGIGLSPDKVGEYCFSLFAVAAISLLLSWLLAVVITPLFGSYLLQAPDAASTPPFQGRLYQRYHRLLRATLRHRWRALAGLILLTLLCAGAFRWVSQSFFPPSATPLFYVKMYFPHGTDIRTTSERAKTVEQWLQQQEYVDWVTTYVGGGAERFILVYDPQLYDPSYAEFIVHTPSLEQIDHHRPEVERWLVQHFPSAEVKVTRPDFGPGNGANIEYRISGRDPVTLSALSQQVQQQLKAHPSLTAIRDDWGTPTPRVTAVVNDDKARMAGITRMDIDHLLAYAGDGLRGGLYREGDQLLPIMVRSAQTMDSTEALHSLQLYSRTQQRYIPISEVVEQFSVTSEWPMLLRRDRQRTVTVSADVRVGMNVHQVFNQIRADVTAVPLPFGYHAEWGGQYEQSRDAQTSLAKQMPLGFLSMIIIVLLMFGRVKPALVVLLVVPMSICGVTVSLLLCHGSFGFMALLGFLSLFGMLIKNAIVLVDEIEQQIKAGRPRYRAVVDSSQSRLRPVALAAGTTILGMAPLLWDPFFADMAITIMGGLAFATVLTMLVVPLLYTVLFGVEETEC